MIIQQLISDCAKIDYEVDWIYIRHQEQEIVSPVMNNPRYVWALQYFIIL